MRVQGEAGATDAECAGMPLGKSGFQLWGGGGVNRAPHNCVLGSGKGLN